MKKHVLTLIAGLLLTTFSAHAEMKQYDIEESTPYLVQLFPAGKNQKKFQEFYAVVTALEKQGFLLDLNRTNFYAEIIDRSKTSDGKTKDYFNFAIGMNFSGKTVVREGVTYQQIPYVEIQGSARETCDNNKKCTPLKSIQYGDYKLSWREIPALGGGTSSAGTK
jgi:hypothetical protein